MIPAFLFASCVKEESSQDVFGEPTIVKATVEDFGSDTKAAVSDDGAFTWQADDYITAYNENYSPLKSENLSQDGLSANADFTFINWDVNYSTAIYPGDVTLSNGKLTLPSERTWKKNDATPVMYATLENSRYEFKHVGGVVKVIVKNVPTEARKFVFYTPGYAINGKFDLAEDNGVKSIKTSETTVETQQSYALDFSETDITNPMVFYVPLPVGTYTKGFNFKLYDESYNTVGEAGGSISQTVNRRALLKMPVVTLVGGTGEGTNTTVDSAEEVNDAMEGSTNVTVSMVAPSEGSTTASIELPKKEASAAEATHYLTIGSIAESTEKIEIVEDKTNDTGNSISDLIINVPTTEDAKKLVIDMPNTTVTIAVNGESVTFEEVEATTAENTLVVTGGVTIKDLIIKAGNVSVQSGGKVDKITISEENKANATYVTYVGAEARKVAYVANLDGLNTALADNTVTEIIFLDNIETSEKTCILSSVVINGNNKELIYTGSDRAIEVATNGVDLTINDLNIEFTSGYCNRGIQYATSGKLKLNNVTVESDVVTYVLNFPIPSSNANVTITKSTLKGLIALNIWGENMTVNVIDSDLTSVDKNSAENYAAVSLSFDGTNGANGTIVNIEGGSITAKDENDKPSTAVNNSTTTGVVNISSTTEVTGEVKNPVALVLYEGASQFYSCYTLNDAIETALEDATGKASVKLIKDINLDTDATISVPSGKTLVIDLNGKTISQTSNTPVSMITNYGNMTITDSGNGSGQILFTFNGTVNNDVAANAISNRGNLVVNNGYINNTGKENQIGYAIDNYNGSTLIVNGGKINASGSLYYDGIRLFCGSNETTVTVNQGSISTIWAQNPSANKATEVKGTVIFNGGEVNTIYYENYTTVKVKNGVNATVNPYGEGKENTKTITEGEYTVYSFAQQDSGE